MSARGPLPALVKNPHIGAWLELDAEGRVTVFAGKVEFGQGIRTAQAQLVAHELDVSVSCVTVASVETHRSPDEGVTSGSRSIEEANEGLRIAAAHLRAALCRRAAERLSIAVDDVSVDHGDVVAPDGRRVSYADLASPSLAQELIDGDAQLRSVGGDTVLGASVQRLDLPAKVAGRPVFVQDMELPGMLHGRVLRPPSVNARLADLDHRSVRAMPGVRCIVRDGSFVGVVAEREEEAMRAVARLRRLAAWQDGEHLPPNPRFMLSEATQDVLVHERREAGVRHADLRSLSAEFSRPYVAHASLGPSCAIAQRTGDSYRVWSHSQGIFHLRQELAKVLRVAERAVQITHVEGAGCYGANGADDAALDATLLARAMPGTPVRLSWSRDDEFAWEPFGTAMFVRLSASLDANDRIANWQHEVWGNGHRDRAGPNATTSATNLLAARHLAQSLSPSIAPGPPSPSSGGGRNAAPPYGFRNQRIINHYVPRTPIRVSALRSLGAHANVFASESFMDEIASAIGAEPVKHRLSYLDDPRAREVIERVAANAGWWERPHTVGQGFGIGFAQYKNAGAYVAVVVKLDLERDLRLRQVWAVIDAGLVVNPDGIRNQTEGGILQAASWTINEEVRFDATSITTRDWTTYPVMRFSDAPDVDVDVIVRPKEPPVGVGEAVAGPTAAAIGNALYDASGVRVRDMPFTRDRLAGALA